MPRLGLSTFAAVALAAASLGGCIIESDDDGDSSITVENRSSFLIEEIRVTEIDSTNWGPNLLGGDILRPQESLTILVDCDIYDVLIVDDTGLECILFDLDLCFDDAVWVITNGELAACEGSFRAPAEAALLKEKQAQASLTSDAQTL
jgi:hypothetical protein